MAESRRLLHTLLTREVNDRVYDLLSELGGEEGEFLCECGDGTCSETLSLTLHEYAARRAQPERTPLKLSEHPG